MSETKNITGVLIDTVAGIVGIATIEDDLPELYKALHCDIIDIVNRRIGGKYFTIVCDDEGLYKDPAMISAVDNCGRAMLVGSLFICQTDSGKLASLTAEEQKYVLRRVVPLGTRLHPTPYPMLTCCEF